MSIDEGQKKGEKAGIQQFFLLPQCFYTIKEKVTNLSYIQLFVC